VSQWRTAGKVFTASHLALNIAIFAVIPDRSLDKAAWRLTGGFRGYGRPPFN
jgi:hypothetical protein